MADEQIIYLSPEEELTNVRARLEQVPSKRLILVIPQQTQLRSLVGWRLLHSRARELNKEILIISSDRQIRSVVKAAGFRVADSLASKPSPSKTRPEGRASRSNTGNKPTPHLRGTTNRSAANQQTATPDSRQAGQPGLSMPPIQPVQDFPSISDLPTIDYELETNKPRDNEPTTRGSSAPASQTSPSSSSTFDRRNHQFGPDYDFRVGEVPPIHPLNPEADEEEPDLWIEDISHAQNLRNAAQQEQDEDELLPPPQNMAPPPAFPLQNDASYEERISDPLAFMDDIPSSPLPEQRGAVAFDDLDEDMPDISDYPTDVIPEADIEDLGDQGNIVDSPRSWADMTQEDERDTQNPPRIYDMRSRSGRTGGMQPPPPREGYDDEDEDELPPIYDQPTRMQPPQAMPPVRPAVPPAASTGSRTFSVAQNEPRPVALPQNRSAQSRTTQQKQQRPAPMSTRARQPARAGTGRAVPPQPNRTQRAARPPRRGNEIVISVAIGILIFLIIGAIVYLLPSADVTVSVPFRNYSLSMTLNASSTGKQNATPGIVQGQTLTYDTSASGKAVPTGTAPVGNAQATGSVNFTNKSSQLVEIPTGMQLSTRSGITFITTLDVKLPPANSGSSYTPPVTVQAQNSGTAGNVAASTIVSITPTGQQLLLQFNPGLSASLLTVTNPQATTGGGVGKATALSTGDVNTLKAKLHTEVQTKLSDWLTKQLHVGDQTGKPVSVETVSTTPAVGTVITNGTFTETLKLHATVLVVRKAAIQSAASAAMNASVSKNKLDAGYTLYEPQQLNITQMKNTPSSNGSLLKLSFIAAGQIIPGVSVQQIRGLLAGKRVSEVQSTLTGPGGVNGVVAGKAVVHPDFFPWLPFLSSHINVHIVPAQAPTSPPVHLTPTPTKKK